MLSLISRKSSRRHGPLQQFGIFLESSSAAVPLLFHDGNHCGNHRRLFGSSSMIADNNTSSADTSDQSVRLSKLLTYDATNITISRRQAEKLIHNGQVTIAGQIVKTPHMLIDYKTIQKSIDSKSPLIKVDGKPIMFDLTNTNNNNAAGAIPKVWAVHKISGEVVTEHDPQNRMSLMDRLHRSGVGRIGKNKRQSSKQQYHLKPIGRLDLTTEGLILVTNNGDYAREMELPSSLIHRVYRVRVHGLLTSYKLDCIRQGKIKSADGFKYSPMKVLVERRKGFNNNSRSGKTSRTSTNTWLQVVCTEGKNRQIRNVFSALGLSVTRLIRIAYGDYELDTIPPGMAIPVPYKPVAKQKAKGPLLEQQRQNNNQSRVRKNNTVNSMPKASPVKWVTSVGHYRSMHSKTIPTDTIKYHHGYDKTMKDKNDDIEGQLTSQHFIQEEVLSKFPQEHIVYSFGYGSGVFSQTLQNSSKNHEGMLDLILVVDNTMKFHQSNLEMNPNHYATWLRWGGPNLITKIQRQFPLKDAHVLFHVVDDHPVPMKYGIVDKEDLLRDLTQWESLYLAGRLQKPTMPLMEPPEDLVKAQQQNWDAAVAAALLISSSSNESGLTSCTWQSLFRTIASLSYTGDFRMQVGGEDPQKLNKLVDAPGQLQRFQRLYDPALDTLDKCGVLVYDSSTDGIDFDVNDESTLLLLHDQLPQSLQSKLSDSSLFSYQEPSKALSKAIADIVGPPARHQSFKGIFTLGFRKSVQYAGAKLSKGLFSGKT